LIPLLLVVVSTNDASDVAGDQGPPPNRHEGHGAAGAAGDRLLR
jgi:hypothetical protein